MAPTRKPTAGTVDQKAGDVSRAFTVLRDELTTPAMRELVALASPDGTVQQIGLGVQIARIVAANDRAALLAAAMVVQSGIVRQPPLDVIEGGEGDV